MRTEPGFAVGVKVTWMHERMKETWIDSIQKASWRKWDIDIGKAAAKLT